MEVLPPSVSSSPQVSPICDLFECLKDSPQFRHSLEQNENEMNDLEVKLDKLVKLCSTMVDIGKSFVRAKSNFINGIWDLLSCFRNDPTMIKSLNRIIATLTELLKYDTILLDQANRAVTKNLGNFIREDIAKVKETKKHFDRISDEMDSSLIKNSAAPKSKPNELEEANNMLAATRSCFQHMALDYVSQLSTLQTRKRHESLDALLSLMHAYSTHFHQGFDLLQDQSFHEFKKNTAGLIHKMRDETNALEKQLDNKHNLVRSNDIIPTLISQSSDHVLLEGYLFKRTTNAFKTWNRRWFIIQDHQLVYQKRSHEAEVTIMEEDLRLCTARPVVDIDRRFCFEVLSPSKTHILQADSEEAVNAWLNAFQAGINAAYHDERNNTDQTQNSHNSHSQQAHSFNNEQSEGLSVDSQESWCTASSASAASGGSGASPSTRSSSSINNLLANSSSSTGITGISHSHSSSHLSMPPAKPPRAPHTQIISLPGNEFCADCGSHETRWASINLGITLCIECSGIHRSLGVHLSKVRSLTLDAWEPELVRVMLSLGNTIVNEVYEARVDEVIGKAAIDELPVVRATPDCSRSTREGWIKAKYVAKKFVVVGELRKARTKEEGDETIVNGMEEEMLKVLKEKCDQESNNKSEESSFDESLKESTSSNNKTSTSATCKSSGPSRSSKRFGTVDPVMPSPRKKNSQEETDIIDETSVEISQKSPKLNPVLPLTPEDYNYLLHQAASDCDIPVMHECLAKGASVNWINEKDGGQTALHKAIASESVIACEFLLLNGAKCNSMDFSGRTALHVATQLGNTGQVCLLLKRGADQSFKDSSGHDALSIAINNANADIVTLLRLAKLNEEMKNDDFGTPSDETFNDVVRDFSQLASHSPEKLRRTKSGGQTTDQS